MSEQDDRLSGTPRQNLRYQEVLAELRDTDWCDLDAFAQRFWADYAAELADAQAEAISDIIGNRRVGKARPKATRPRAPDTYVGSRPKTPGSLPRRQRAIARGFLPDAFYEEHRRWGYRSVLAVIAREILETGRCNLFVDQIGALAGYCRSTVQAALKYAEDKGWITVKRERPPGRRRNLPNVVHIVDERWVAWLHAKAKAWRGLTQRGRRFWLQSVGSIFATATGTQGFSIASRSRDNSVGGAPSAPKGAAGGWTARTGPARPRAVAPG